MLQISQTGKVSNENVKVTPNEGLNEGVLFILKIPSSGPQVAFGSGGKLDEQMMMHGTEYK